MGIGRARGCCSCRYWDSFFPISLFFFFLALNCMRAFKALGSSLVQNICIYTYSKHSDRIQTTKNRVNKEYNHLYDALLMNYLQVRNVTQ